MTFGAFLKDRIWSVIALLALLALGGYVLTQFQFNPYAAALLGIAAITAVLLPLAHQYARQKAFYREVLQLRRQGDKLHQLTHILPEATFQEGQFLRDTLEQTGKGAADEIHAIRQEVRDFTEYIELWLHEVKIPLATAKLTLENQSDGADGGVQQELHRMEELLEQVLFFARSSAVENDYSIRPVTLDALVNSVVRRNAKDMIAAGVSVQKSGLGVTVGTDAKWLEFILQQLLNNALKYRKNPSRVRFAGGKEADNVILHIEDNGIGIAAADLPQIFKKGFVGQNGRQDARSTGMGLYLCKKLCDRLGIGLSIDSKEGVGTAVRLEFPATEYYLTKM